jgi:hypothetical protein
LARSWSRKNPEEAINWLESVPDVRLRNEALGEMRVDLLTVSGMNRLFKVSENDGVKTSLARRYSAALAAENPAKALEWVNTIQEQKVRESARSQAAEIWIRDNPMEAAGYIATLPEELAKKNLVQRLVSQWGREDIDAAMKWVENLPAGKDRDAAMATAVREMRDAAPEKALAILQQIQDPQSRGAATVDVIRHYAQDNGPSAAVLASALSPELQPRAFHDVIRGWGFSDMTASGNWIKSLPPGEGRDSAIKAYVSVIDGADPAMAVKWASTIQSPTERPEAMMQAFQRWAQEDSGAAEKWLADGPVDPAFKPFFQKELEERRKRPADSD